MDRSEQMFYFKVSKYKWGCKSAMFKKEVINEFKIRSVYCERDLRERLKPLQVECILATAERM